MRNCIAVERGERHRDGVGRPRSTGIGQRLRAMRRHSSSRPALSPRRSRRRRPPAPRRWIRRSACGPCGRWTMRSRARREAPTSGRSMIDWRASVRLVLCHTARQRVVVPRPRPANARSARADAVEVEIRCLRSYGRACRAAQMIIRSRSSKHVRQIPRAPAAGGARARSSAEQHEADDDSGENEARPRTMPRAGG